MILNPGLTREKPGFGFEGVNPGLGYLGSGFALSSPMKLVSGSNWSVGTYRFKETSTVALRRSGRASD